MSEAPGARPQARLALLAVATLIGVIAGAGAGVQPAVAGDPPGPRRHVNPPASAEPTPGTGAAAKARPNGRPGTRAGSGGSKLGPGRTHTTATPAAPGQTRPIASKQARPAPPKQARKSARQPVQKPAAKRKDLPAPTPTPPRVTNAPPIGRVTVTADSPPAIATVGVSFWPDTTVDHQQVEMSVFMLAAPIGPSVTGLAYQLTLPSGLVIAANGVTNNCGGTAVGVPGTSTITLSGGVIPANHNGCGLQAAVTAAASGTYPVSNGNLSGLSGNLTADVGDVSLTVTAAQPRLDAVFSPGTITTLDTSTLTLTLSRTDTNSFSVASDLGYVVTLPDGLVVAAGTPTNTCGGTATATPGGATVTVAGGSLTGNASCQVTLPVSAGVSGAYVLGHGSVSSASVDANVTRACMWLAAICGPHVIVDKAPQTIVFDPPATMTVSAGTATLTASGSVSGVTFAATPDTVCTVDGTTLHLIAVGDCIVTANAPGNGTYLDADEVLRQITIVAPGPARLNQTIAFGQPAPVALSAGTTTVSATASSGLPVTFTSGTASVCTVAGGTVTLLAAGTCTITAGQAGDDEYLPADPVTRGLTVEPSPAPPPSVPGSVTAVAGVSSITVSWSAPADTTGITGYVASATPGPATCSTTGATSCVMGGTAGTTYTIRVVARRATGDSAPSAPSGPVVPTAPQPPSTPPVTDLVLTTTDGLITTATPGQEITFVGTGFAPYSTVVISIYSAPTVLGSVVTDRIGNFSKLITVPPGLSGKHTVTAQGVDPAGNARAMNLAITVLRVGAVRGAMLPTTGARPDITLLVGVLTVAVGGLLVALSTPRRRRVPSLRRAVPEGTAAVPAAAFRTSIRLASQGH